MSAPPLPKLNKAVRERVEAALAKFVPYERAFEVGRPKTAIVLDVKRPFRVVYFWFRASAGEDSWTADFPLRARVRLLNLDDMPESLNVLGALAALGLIRDSDAEAVLAWLRESAAERCWRRNLNYLREMAKALGYALVEKRSRRE